ncbi:MAG TPA: glycosyltransferase [Xanthobacteraceae bacterium]|nr:glycosyltransferase [Xanthobacteraceae bacterium]
MSSPFLLLSAPEGDFYAHILRCFAAGFESLGIPCLQQNPHIGHEALAQWAAKFRPAAVLEINCVLSLATPWPQDVPHLAWLQDHRFGGYDLTQNLGNSRHLYFIVHPSSFGIVVPRERAWSILLPAARVDPPAQVQPEMQRDFSMAGYIPAPLDADAPVAFMADGSPVELERFLSRFPVELLSDAAFSMRDIHSAIAKTCQEIGCGQITDRGTLQTFDEILVRTLERRRILEDVIASGGTLEIFGPPTWEKWPQFAPYYRGHIADPRQLDPIFQTTRINLHNSGLTMHFRVMDCLAAGGFMMVNETPWDFLTGGIRNYLEPGRHYGSYKISEVGAVAKRYLADEGARRRIGAEGRRVVLAEHTWRDRARQIMNDIGLAPRKLAGSKTPELERAETALMQIANRQQEAEKLSEPRPL